jgi:hypothetical protein
MAGTRAGAARCKQPMVLEATAVMQQSADKVRLLMVQTFIYSAVMYGAEVWDTTKAVKDKMSAVKKALSILALHPRDCSSDVLYRDTGLLPVYSLMLPNCVGHRCQNMEAGRWGRRCDSHSRVAVVSAGLRWARTGAVMSNPLLSRSSTPEYCQGDCTGGQPACVGSATPQSRITRRRT